MGDVVDAVVDFGEAVIDAVVDALEFVWEEVVVPLAEEVFSWFGIVDEEVVTVQKVSTKLLGAQTGDPIKRANARAVISWLNEDTSFWKVINREIRTPTYYVEGYFRYAEQGRYIHGLPEASVKGGDIDKPAIGSALDSDLGTLNTVLSINTTFTPEDVFFKHELQSSPTNYKPGLDILTYDDEWGNSWDDWYWDGIEFVSGSNNYEITVSRVAEQALFWIESPDSVVEGSSISFNVRCNRTVPAGSTVTVNIVYSGTLDSSEYTVVSSVDMLENTDVIELVIPITDDAISETPKTLIASIDSIINSIATFESVGFGASSSKTVNVYDNEGLALLMNSAIAGEAESSITIPVELTEAATAAFTVDYSFTDGTAIGGVDYDNTGGTLNFAGTAGEIQNIVIPLTPDVVTGSREDFTVNLSNSSDPAVSTVIDATVTLVDTDIGHPELSTVINSQIIVKPNYTKIRSLILTYHDNSDAVEDWYYWIYDLSLGTYPDVTPKMSLITDLDMLPAAILRREKISINEDKSSEEYRTGRLLLNRLGLNINDIIESIEENPDINDVDDIYINFSMSPDDNNPVLSKMMFLSFYEIIFVHGITSNTNQYIFTFKEEDIQNAIVWTDQQHIVGLPGNVTDVGFYRHEIVPVPETLDEDGNVENPSKTNFVIQYQKSDGVYDQIIITNLSSLSTVEYDGYHKVAVNELSDGQLTIPISWYVFDQLEFKEVVNVYEDILRIDMNALLITHLEWYETSAFWDLLKVVGIILTIVSLGTAGSIYLALVQLATQFIVLKLVIFVAELTGNTELAAVLGLIAMVVIGPKLGLAPIDFTTAEGLTTLVTDFSASLGAATSVEFKKLQGDIDELMGEFEEVKEKYNNMEGGPLIDGSEYVALTSVDTNVYMARGVQYDFDAALSGNYDRLVGNYCDSLLKVGVI